MYITPSENFRLNVKKAKMFYLFLRIFIFFEGFEEKRVSLIYRHILAPNTTVNKLRHMKFLCIRNEWQQ